MVDVHDPGKEGMVPSLVAGLYFRKFLPRIIESEHRLAFRVVHTFFPRLRRGAIPLGDAAKMLCDPVNQRLALPPQLLRLAVGGETFMRERFEVAAPRPFPPIGTGERRVEIVGGAAGGNGVLLHDLPGGDIKTELYVERLASGAPFEASQRPLGFRQGDISVIVHVFPTGLINGLKAALRTNNLL